MNSTAPTRIPDWISVSAQGWLLRLHIQPGARQCGCVGVHGDALKIRISAPPADGKANQELLDWLRQQLNVSARAIELVSGQSSRQKRVMIHAEHAGHLTLERIEGDLLAASRS